MMIKLPHLSRGPLARYADGAVQQHNGRPVPLRHTNIDVHIQGGLAIVRTERAFRNDEVISIEAVVTFPVPVHAVLAGLSVRIAGRTRNAQAQLREAAREAYETALDRGKTAVLHEEAMPGIHILTIGHLPAGEEVVVNSIWAQQLSARGPDATLRIPTTIGDVYGRPPLPDSDAPIHANIRHMARLSISSDKGVLSIAGVQLQEGTADILLNAPIDIHISGWAPSHLLGRSADGRQVSLDIQPAPIGEAPVDLALLIDRSGSMATRVARDDPRSTLQAVADGLRLAAPFLKPGDRVEGWQFDDEAELIAPQTGQDLFKIAAALQPPRGGTQIGGALTTVLKKSAARDILLVTDGNSYSLDVQTIAAAGRRINVVLVGEAALDAKVGHLAALTGGELFIAAGSDLDGAVRQAISALRSPFTQPVAAIGLPDKLKLLRAGMLVRAEWTRAPCSPAANDDASIIGAVAAALALPSLPETIAAQVAQAHGLVTHMTSLVLVDEAGDMQAGLPAQRQVPLSTPFVAASLSMSYEMVPSRAQGSAPMPPNVSFSAYEPDPMFINWDEDPSAFLRGDLRSLPYVIREAIEHFAQMPAIVELAQALGQPPVVLVLALIAMKKASYNRTAMRFGKQVLGKVDLTTLAAADAEIDLMVWE